MYDVRFVRLSEIEDHSISNIQRYLTKEPRERIRIVQISEGLLYSRLDFN